MEQNGNKLSRSRTREVIIGWWKLRMKIKKKKRRKEHNRDLRAWATPTVSDPQKQTRQHCGLAKYFQYSSSSWALNIKGNQKWNTISLNNNYTNSRKQENKKPPRPKSNFNLIVSQLID